MAMGNLHENSWEEIWESKQAESIRDCVKNCDKNCWMIGSVAPAMQQKIWVPALWVLKHKLKGSYSLSENKFI